MQKKIALIQDISGYGRCSLTTSIPVLSAFGHQCCPLPTAVLSAHTEYPDPYIVDMSCHLAPIIRYFERLALRFEAVYSGYLCTEEQVRDTLDLIGSCASKDCLVLVDPVMGDNGVCYVEQSEGFIDAVRRLCARAHVITPNLTEAAILLGEPFEALQREESIKAAMRRLARMGPDTVVVTGIEGEDGRLGSAYYSAHGETVGFYARERVPGHYPGTGDLFASVLLGGLLSGGEDVLPLSVKRAVDFVAESAALTHREGSAPLDGVQFERLLYRLSQRERER